MKMSAMEVPLSKPRAVQGQWQQGPPPNQDECSRPLSQIQKEEIAILTPSLSANSVSQYHVSLQSPQQEGLATWHSLIASVFNSEAYTKAQYRPAGSWVEIISIVSLTSDMAAMIYPSCTEAFIIGAQLSNRGEQSASKAYAKSYFIVSTISPMEACTGYLAEWSEEDYAYIVHRRTNVKPAYRDSGWAFDNFNFCFGLPEEAAFSTNGDENGNSNEEHEDSEDAIKKGDESEDESPQTESSSDGASSDELTSASTPELNADTKPITTGELAPSVQSWITNATGRDWADIDEEEQEEDLALNSLVLSDIDEGCVARPNSPIHFLQEEENVSIEVVDEACLAQPSISTPYYQDGHDVAINQLETTSSSTAVLALAEEEGEDGSNKTDQEAETSQYLSIDSFAALEDDFWNEIYAAPENQANPIGQLCNENYQEPAGDYHALSFACYPQNFRSTTSAAVSLWAVSSTTVFHHVHGFSSPHESKRFGVPFTRQSILAAQACKTVNPVRYDGPGNVFADNVGTRLHDALIGWASNTFLPVGRHVDEPVDPENPHDLHTPTDAHWSVLTIPRTYLTPPYVFNYSDPDHDLPTGLQGGTGKSRRRAVVLKASGLRNVELCYDADDEEVVTLAQDAEEHINALIMSKIEDEITALTTHQPEEEFTIFTHEETREVDTTSMSEAEEILETEAELKKLPLVTYEAEEPTIVVTPEVEEEVAIITISPEAKDYLTTPSCSAVLESRLDIMLDAKLDALLETKLDTLLDTKLSSRLETILEAKIDSIIETKLQKVPETAQLEATLEAKVVVKLDDKLEAMLTHKLEQKLADIFPSAPEIAPLFPTETTSEPELKIQATTISEPEAESEHTSEPILGIMTISEPEIEPETLYNETVTTRPVTACFGENLLTAFSWTAAGAVLVAAGIAVSAFRGLRR